ncbi:MAG TPA: galactokinase [Mucilaginibacter sp.]|nr:galactokinase [Mucilaginibacter sp.]
MKPSLEKAFENIFKKTPQHIYFCPGRVNLIGEHIDYNGGLVMPCAITFGTYLLLSPNKDNVFRFRSLNFKDTFDAPIQTGYQKENGYWYNYPLGVVDYFFNEGHQVSGMDMLFYGDIPIGSGLSSSASIEVVTAFALNTLSDKKYTKLDLVKLSKSVENNFIGVACGIMDQFAVAFGEKNKALMLNCDTLEYKAVDSNLGDHVLVIINTNKSRKLSESRYNERVQECAAALQALRQEIDIQNLCELNGEELNKNSYLIADETVLKRAQHVVGENDRVKLAAVALGKNDLAAFGELMYASHQSLRDLYEVSGKELDTIVDYCKTDSNVAGARMTGAGLGGCAIALVKESAFDEFKEKVTTYYTDKVGYEPSVYRSLIGDGVRELL